jgi:hypothetical protein
MHDDPPAGFSEHWFTWFSSESPLLRFHVRGMARRGIARCGQESDDQAIAVADALDASLGLVGDLGEGVAGEVGQLAALEVRPQVLDRVELGGVGGQPRDGSQSRWASRWALSPSHSSTMRWRRSARSAAV